MWKNLQPQEFHSDFSRKEQIKFFLQGILVIMIIAAFFYRSVWAIPFLLPILYVYVQGRKKEIRLSRRRETQIQFRDAILSVASNQKAGYSVENSFMQAYTDMVLLYGKDSIICKELYSIEIGLRNNMVLEKLLYDFGYRSQVEDIIEFAKVFAAAKRNGGNMTEIIKRSAAVIDSKTETEKEIQILLTARRMEQKIMNLVPFGILMYIGVTSRGFFDSLYHNLPGIIIMTVCLLVYITAVLMSRKIVEIEV